MPPKPWVTLQRPDPDQGYLALLSELPLKRFRDLLTFGSYTKKIEGQLRGTPGVLGYSLKARLLAKLFWTLSVWESEAALQEFVARDPHRRVMSAMQPRMGQTRFVRWHVRGAEVPPRWRDAFEQRAARAP